MPRALARATLARLPSSFPSDARAFLGDRALHQQDEGSDRPVVQTHAVVYFGPNPTSGQYSQTAGTQRKTSPATATWQTDGNDR
jgi:hypothetical protein